MIKYLVIIAGVFAYDAFQIIKKGKMRELVVLTLFLVLAIASCYIFVNNPFDASFAELVLKLVDSDYIKGNK